MARKSKYSAENAVTISKMRIYRAGQYGRLSVEDGDDPEQNSIGNQRKLAEDYLQIRSDIQIVEHYADNGYSGMNFNRPGFQQMMADLDNGLIDCVIVKDISRFGRNFLLTSEYVERRLPDMGVRLVSINDEYDSIAADADATALVLPLKMVMNDQYVRDISRKIKSGIEAKMSNGTFLPASGSIPYGYLRDPERNTYQVDEETAPIVLRIYQLRSEGMAFSAIAKLLNAQKIPSPGNIRYLRGMTTSLKYQNALWEHKTVKKILTDSVYIGTKTHGKVARKQLGGKKQLQAAELWKCVSNAHAPIISEELFSAVQGVNQKKQSERAEYQPRNGFEQDYRDVFRGLIVCGDCGSKMRAAKGCARENASSPSRIFYDCSNYKDSGHIRCSCHYIRQEQLMQTVQNVLHQQLCFLDQLEIGHLSGNGHLSALQTQMSSVRVKQRGTEGKLQRLLIDLTEGLIDTEEYNYSKKRYNQELADLTRQEQDLRNEILSVEREKHSQEKIIKQLQKYRKIETIDRALMELLVKEIHVFENRRIEVLLNFVNPMAKTKEKNAYADVG